MTNRKIWRLTALGVFLLAELVLYIQILAPGGSAHYYPAICLCLAYALTNCCRAEPWLLGGLACTAGADFFLLICDPIQRLWGMVFFLGTQACYGAKLHQGGRLKWLLPVRAVATAGVVAVAFAVLKENTDALAIVSICYYVNLALNIVGAFARFREGRLFAIGLVLFLLCDTVVGLQVMGELYLPIGEDSLLHRILYPNVNLAWLFYLPSQVLIALSSGKQKNKEVCL